MTISLPCPACGTNAGHRFLLRDNVPVQQNILVSSAAAARKVPRGTLDLHVCADCGFVWNAAFDLGLLDYGADYDNTQSCSSSFDAYMDDLARELVEQRGVRDARVVEIGCGKGLFLRKLVTWPDSGNSGTGFDTSYVGPQTDLDGRLRFERRFYDETCVDVPADAVVCRHVIEHVPDPLVLMQAVRAALADAPHARIWFETPSVDWILRGEVLWDFFYEHCSLFTAGSLSRLFRRAGFEVTSVRHIFGGQYLWLEAKPGAADERSEPQETSTLALSYGAKVDGLRSAWSARLTGLAQSGRVALWGAGAKGATFANLVDPEAAVIDCVVDLNPAKQGRFIPGTGHAIVPPQSRIDRGVTHVLVMNPNYRAEIAAQVAGLGIKITLLDWSNT
jgi:SAM-dependent methyltransferase